MMDAPLRFQSFLRPLPWGGRRLGDALGKPLPDSGPHGESWEVSDHPTHRSQIVEGPLAGLSLRDVMERHRSELLGHSAPPFSTFPWLVKFLDVHERFSVQVHPDDEAAARLWPGEGGKTEAWFVVAAAPGARAWAGLLPGVDEEQLRAALAQGRVAECLHEYEPRPGDCLFLPAGTVHAAGGGVLLAEVQQTSDATFRLYDWDRVDAEGRRRTLHVEEALSCIDWSRGPVQPVRAEGFPEAPFSRRLAVCRYFQIDYICETTPFICGGTGRMQVLMALHGRGRLAGAALTAGDTLLLPAAMGEAECVPDGPLALLSATLP
jgi:mannose-6-phosphate isomerase